MFAAERFRCALLQFDHKNGDGAAHRREIGKTPMMLFRWIKKNMAEAKERLQVLCSNCNVGSWRNGGICPHQQEFNIIAMAMSQQVAIAA